MPAPHRNALIRDALALALLALLAAGFRGWLAYPAVFPPDGHVLLTDTDAYFHLRHAGHVMRHFPRLERMDDAWDFPDVHRSDGAGLFDVCVGGLALAAAGGRVDERTLERTCAVAPLLAQVAVLLVLAAFARRLLGPALALWVAAAFVAYPGLSLPVTALGYCDHHVAEMLCVVAVLYALTRMLLREGQGAAAAATPLVLFLFTWVGAGLWVPILGLGVIALLGADLACAGPDDPGYAAHARGLAVYAATAVAAGVVVWTITPVLVIHPRSLGLALAALAALALYAALHRPAAALLARRGAGPRGSAALLGALPVVIAVTLVAATPSGRALAGYLLVPKTALVVEHREIDPGLVAMLWGAPALLAAAAGPLVAARARRDGEARVRLVPVVAGLSVAGLWLLTRDYGYQPASLVPLLAGLALHELALRWPGLRAVAPVPLALILAIPFLPSPRVMRPWLTAADVAELQEVDLGWLHAAEWLRDHTPANGLPAVERAAATTGSYGVASSWDRGNLIVAVAHRRARWARYPTEKCGRWFTETGEQASLDLLCRDCPPDNTVRYVVVDAPSVSRKFLALAMLGGRPLDPYRATAGAVEFQGTRHAPATYGAAWRDAVSVRLYYLDGETLTHYRLVYESPDRSCHYFLVTDAPPDVMRDCAPAGALPAGGPVVVPGGLAHDISQHAQAKVFEVVPGAELAGRAGPGAAVELSLKLRCVTSGREFVQRRRLQATPAGLWRARVPYASKPEPDDAVRGMAPYRVRWLDEKGIEVSRDVDVTNDDVAAGRVVQVNP